MGRRGEGRGVLVSCVEIGVGDWRLEIGVVLYVYVYGSEGEIEIEVEMKPNL
jgi:hypothetical protein